MFSNYPKKNLLALTALGFILGACSDGSPSLSFAQNAELNAETARSVSIKCGKGHNGSQREVHTFVTTQPESLSIADWTVKQYNSAMKINSIKKLPDDQHGYEFYIKYGISAGGDVGLTLELDTSRCASESRAILTKRNVGGFAAGVITNTHDCTCEGISE